MARLMTEPMSYHHLGSLASQTTLAGMYDEGGQSWAPQEKKASKPRLLKIKSSPGSGGALSAAREEQKHRRGNSTNATPTSPTFVPDYLLRTSGSSIPTAHASPPVQPKKRSRPKISPFSSHKSDGDSTPIDLSRSAVDNEEALAEVYRSSRAGSKTTLPLRSDSASMRRVGGAIYNHSRAASGISQASSMGAGSMSSQYVHPLRQTPMPYTPPLVGSYKNSLDSSSTTTPPLGTPSNEPFDYTSSSTPYATLPSTKPQSSAMNRRPKLPYPLHIRTTSASRLTSSSQTNLPGTPSSLRNAHSQQPSLDLISPAHQSAIASPTTARSSMETASVRSRPFRSRSNTATQTDPVAQAATVAVLRQQFQEKEAKKDRKYAEVQAREQEREARKREKREGKAEAKNEKRRRKHLDMSEKDVDESPDSAANSAGIRGMSVLSPFTSPALTSPLASRTNATGQAYTGYEAHASSPRLYPTRSRIGSAPSVPTAMSDDVVRARTNDSGPTPGRKETHPMPVMTSVHNTHSTASLPAAVNEKAGGRRRGDTVDSRGEKVQSQWSLFWFQFRTFWLKIKRSLGGKKTVNA